MQPGERRLRPLIFVESVGQQAITTAPRQRIADGHAEQVVAAKPLECRPCPIDPAFIADGMKGLDAGGHHRLWLDRLLVEHGRVPASRIEAAAAARGKAAG